MASNDEPKNTPLTSQDIPRPAPQIYQDSVDPSIMINRVPLNEKK